MDKTLGQVAWEKWWEDSSWGPPTDYANDKGLWEPVAAAVVAAYEADQLITWDEAMAIQDWVQCYVPEWSLWVTVRGVYHNNGDFFRDAKPRQGHYRHWFRGQLTHFRRLPPAPKEGK